MSSEQRLATWRSAALLAILVGAIGSIGFFRRAPQHPPPLLVVGFVFWILAPFAMLAMANLASKRWPPTVGITLSVVTLLVSVASLLVYLDDNISHRASKPAFVFVAVPPASVILSGLALAIAGMKVRKPGQ